MYHHMYYIIVFPAAILHQARTCVENAVRPMSERGALLLNGGCMQDGTRVELHLKTWSSTVGGNLKWCVLRMVLAVGYTINNTSSQLCHVVSDQLSKWKLIMARFRWSTDIHYGESHHSSMEKGIRTDCDEEESYWISTPCMLALFVFLGFV